MRSAILAVSLSLSLAGVAHAQLQGSFRDQYVAHTYSGCMAAEPDAAKRNGISVETFEGMCVCWSSTMADLSSKGQVVAEWNDKSTPDETLRMAVSADYCHVHAAEWVGPRP